MTNYLRPEQHIAISYMAQPKNGGLTMEQVAEKAGVSRATLFNWRKTSLFEKELKAEMVRHNRSRLAEVIDRLSDMVIKDGNAAAAKLLLQMNGMLTDKVEVSKPVDSPINYDNLDAEIDSFSKRFLTDEDEESNGHLAN